MHKLMKKKGISKTNIKDTETNLPELCKKYNFDINSLQDDQQIYLGQYPHDINLIQTAYNRVVARHRSYVLAQQFEKEFLESDVISKVAKELTASEDKSKLDLKEIQGKLTTHDVTRKIREGINKQRDQDRSYKANLLRDYRTRLDILLREAAKYIYENLMKEEDASSLQSSNTGSGIYNYFWPSIGEIRKFRDSPKEIQNLDDFILHHRDDGQGYNLIKILKTMQFNDRSNLQLVDFINVHKNLMQAKEIGLNEKSKNFLTKYKEEIREFESSSDYFNGRLFYGYVELIEALLEYNRDKLEQLFGENQR